MILYKTVKDHGEAEYVADKSKFIGHVEPVMTAEEAETFISRIKKQNKDANHNVPIYLIGEKFEIQKCSDDGEPAQTAGAPVLQMLIKEGITNVAVVITRYFGGIKLGTGGLVRAYTHTAKLALDNAGICAVKEVASMKIKIDYTFYGKLQNMALNGDFSIGTTKFEDMVEAEILTELENKDIFLARIAENTAGNFEITCNKKILIKM